MFSGDDKNPGSGRLELRYHDGSESYVDEGFLCATLNLGSIRSRLRKLLRNRLKLAHVLACPVSAFASALVCQACSGSAA